MGKQAKVTGQKASKSKKDVPGAHREEQDALTEEQLEKAVGGMCDGSVRFLKS